MNKFKKIGVSALAGSLAMVSANAVEYAVTGDAMIKLVTAEGNEADANSSNGKGYGVDNDIYFNASGELDNGWTVSAYAALNLDGTVTNSSAQLTIGMGSLGTVQFNDVWGVPSYIDDMSSTIHAYEEPWDSTSHGRKTDAFGADTQSGSVSYLTPSFDFGGASISATATYDPNSGSGAVTPGGVGANDNSGNTYTAKAVVGGFTIGGGIESSETAISGGTGEENVTGYVVWKQGPFAAMYQEFYKNEPNAAGTEGADYEGDTWGISFAQGDWAVSYVENTESKKAVSDASGGKEVTMEAINFSYTMGAMAIKGGLFETSNPEFTTGKYEETEIAISFAF